MTIKQHVPWREVKTTPFNKDRFKGNQEVINDWDLDQTLYVYEPQSLAELGDDANELEYQRVWNKFNSGGHIHIYLVPYREQPELRTTITSVGADWNGLSKNTSIAGYTNKQFAGRPTKRFYSREPLVASELEINNIEIFEENNLGEIINNDGTFKQTTFTLNKFEPFDGGEASYYRDVKFFYGISKPENVDYIQIEQTAPVIYGGISPKGNKGNSIDASFKTVTKNETPESIETTINTGTDGTKTFELPVENAFSVKEVTLGVSLPATTCSFYNEDGGYSVRTTISNFSWDIVDENTISYTRTAVVEQVSGNVCEGLNKTIPMTISFNPIRYIDFGYIENGSIVYDNTNTQYPHLLAPRSTESGILWNVPWTWEYMYLKEQYEGQYNWDWEDGSGSSNYEKPTDGGDTEGKQYNLEGEFCYDGQPAEYRHLGDRNFSGTGAECLFFLPYTVEFGLQRGLSSHGALYVNSNDTDIGSFAYSDSASNGLRPWSTNGGPWATKSTMFAVDFAYDPTIFSIGDSLEMYLSKVKYGIYYMSTDYKNLIDGIIIENAIYDGTPFSSKLGILSDIEGGDYDTDIRKWTENDTLYMGLLPMDIISLAEGYTSNSPQWLDSPVNVGPSNPKIDNGILDFDPAVLRTNATKPFYGKYLDDKKISNYSHMERKALIDVAEGDVSQVQVNYYAFAAGDITIRLFTNVDGILIEIYSLTEDNERQQGRDMSGGTAFTWI